MKKYTHAEIAVMKVPDLRRAVVAAGIYPKGGVSTANRQQLIDWLILAVVRD